MWEKESGGQFSSSKNKDCAAPLQTAILTRGSPKAVLGGQSCVQRTQPSE